MVAERPEEPFSRTRLIVGPKTIDKYTKMPAEGERTIGALTTLFYVSMIDPKTIFYFENISFARCCMISIESLNPPQSQ
jgi:hypothetical protein